ncbi:cryptococcal mannosyltransferase 1-domain-containing protein [Mycena galopus ATCC 62051]|nr:cryptococcal mannosyltransferase 1-domain-containing protein [Mycena galopus ATCC 62051]
MKPDVTPPEKIFIAALFHNDADVLPYWINQITKLIHYLGPDNVFVSILEGYSSDNSPVLLDDFDRRLKQMRVAHRVLTRDRSLVRPASMNVALPRIQFLAALRNRVLRPLVEKGGYERVIFSNNVFVEAESIVELLRTKDGDYDMACGLDLSYWGLYDQWVIRDRLGRIASTLWPYFLEDTGFRAVMDDEPAPVFTCWNGLVSIRAEPFLPLHLRTGQLSTSPLSKPLAPTHPAYPQPANLTPAATPPLRFRASAKQECFSSECFNLPYDLRRRFDLQKIYVNPRVITSYVWSHYVWFKYITRHWAVKWWIEKVENGNGIHLAKLILGNPAKIFQWDGGECHPG